MDLPFSTCAVSLYEICLVPAVRSVKQHTNVSSSLTQKPDPSEKEPRCRHYARGCEVECDWFGFAFVWLGPASEYFHCFEVADLRLRVCLQTTIGFDLHLCGTVASSPVNNAYRSDGSLRRRPKLVWRALFAHLYGSAFVVLRGNSWESTLLNHRLSEVVPAEAARWQRLSTGGVKKKTKNNPLFTVSYFTLFQIVFSDFTLDSTGTTINASGGLTQGCSR